MANNDRLQEVLDHIENNPQTWQQDVWFINRDGTEENFSIEVEEINSCGSAFCFAGHAALKGGFTRPPANNYDSWFSRNEETGRVTYVDEFARDWLGVTNDQADILFSSSNTMDDLRECVAALVEDPDIPWEALGALTSWWDEDGEDDIW